MNAPSFTDVAIVACGVMRNELTALKDEGWLDAGKVLYTPPGLHQDPEQLEHHLVRQVRNAQKSFEKVIVVYGGKFCYVNADNPTRTMDAIIEDLGPSVVRIAATHCMDMLADEQQRAELVSGQDVWWMTPGWVTFRKQVFKGWDQAMANENFPRHDGGAWVLDATGFMDKYMEEHPEEFLEYCDWMSLPMYGAPVTLDRLKKLLTDALEQLDAS